MKEGAGQAKDGKLQRSTALKAELERLSLDWFVAVLARLHINVFRVSCMVPPGSNAAPHASSSPTSWSGMGALTSGSAAFLVASLFNHSCEPNVDNVLRCNDATASFVAVRDIDQV
jgi:hypothetical protein